NSLAGVSNAGQIRVFGGDAVMLIGHAVQNTGSLTDVGNHVYGIQFSRGTAALAAGSEVLFKTSGNQRVFVQAGTGSGAVGVDNQGLVQAAIVELAAAGGNVYALAINDAGTVNAAAFGHVALPNGQAFVTSDGGE